MQPQRVSSNLRRQVDDLTARVRLLGRRLSSVSTVADSANTMGVESAKRFRVAVFTTPLTILGSPVAATVKWSTPMPSEVYKVDAGCSITNTALTYSITNQTAAGCTVTFNAPVLLAAGTVVIVLAISPAPAS